MGPRQGISLNSRQFAVVHDNVVVVIALPYRLSCTNRERPAGRAYGISYACICFLQFESSYRRIERLVLEKRPSSCCLMEMGEVLIEKSALAVFATGWILCFHHSIPEGTHLG